MSLDNIFSLNNKVIIVTGACGLLGTEFSHGISKQGGSVICADIDMNKAIQLADSLKSAYKTNALAVELDITSEESVTNMISTVLNTYGTIDGLVNNAYPRNKLYGTQYESVTLNSWKENVDMHLNGYFNVTHKISKVMIGQKKGVVVNLSSIYGILGPDFSIYEGTEMTMPVEYAAIKGGIVNFTRYLATYLGKYNVRVNTLSPGGIFDNQPESFVNSYSNKTPLGRMGIPKDIVGGLIYLLSDAASYVTGQNLVIDGGWSTK